MNRTITALLLPLTASFLLSSGAAAQNLVISNARIIAGPGQVIEKGAVVIQDGKVASVTAGAAPAAPQGAKVIDATGMTVIAGYIDDHRHIIQARGAEAVAKWMKEQAADRMRELLESGVTTVQSGGDDNAGILELKRKITIREAAELNGVSVDTFKRSFPHLIWKIGPRRLAVQLDDAINLPPKPTNTNAGGEAA